jgi:hypothetical protein
MQAGPIAGILAAQHPAGYWDHPGPGYTPKFRGTVWQLMFLDQLGADGNDPRIRAACEYVLEHTQTTSGGFGSWSGTAQRLAAPPPSTVIHCLNGNLLRALLGFGWTDDPRVQAAIEWEAHAITGAPPIRYSRGRGTTGPGFACGSNDGQPCAWGAIKALLALARVPGRLRSPLVQQAIEQGAAFLLSCDPATAAYPTGYGNTQPSRSWFKLGFPSGGFVADVLQNLEALAELGYAGDDRLRPALTWLLSKHDAQGRWTNELAYTGKTWVDIDRQGAPSKWVTLRACRVLKLAESAADRARKPPRR